jgi:hypothetical protein
MADEWFLLREDLREQEIFVENMKGSEKVKAYREHVKF